MRKHLLSYIIFIGIIILRSNLFAQTQVVIQWQNGFADGGITCLQQTFDGGYILGGISNSGITADKSEPSRGQGDFWIVKTDEAGNKQWDKTIGGSASDYLYYIEQTTDGGYILYGDSRSGISGDKTTATKGSWIVKTNNVGQIQWQRSIVTDTMYGGRLVHSGSSLKTSDNGFIFCHDSLVEKTDALGNIQWKVKTDSIFAIYSFQQTNDGGYILAGASVIIGFYQIEKKDATGTAQWSKRFPSAGTDGNVSLIPFIRQTNDNGYVLGATKQFFPAGIRGTEDFWIAKLDATGNEVWQKDIGGNGTDYMYTFQLTNDGGFLFGGPSQSGISGDKTDTLRGVEDMWVVKTNNQGEIQWQKTLGSSGFNSYSGLYIARQTSDGAYILGGTASHGISGDKTDTGSFWVIKLIGNPRYITGTIFADNDNNCIKNNNENGATNFSLKTTKNNNVFYATSQLNGRYYLGVIDTGQYNIELLPNSIHPYFSPSNCNSYAIHLVDSITTVNFALKPQFLCPYNTVNVSTTTPFRIGRPQTYYVNYCNNGTIASPNTYITIKLDSLLDINGASIFYTTLPNHTYRFNIGNLDFITCGSFTFVATPRINVVQLNQTLCTEAHIYPDTICTTPNYTGAYVVASVQCLGDSVELKLENRGGDMQVRKRYIVIEDQVMRINRNYQLPQNGIIIEKMPADSGHTYRIIAEQEDALPPSYGDKFATAAIEGCRPNPALNFSTGYFTQFPNYDGEPFRAVSCNVITGSYDPNDKVASPVGYAAQHYIEKNTQIDYQINFQNTGNDTAFKVVVVDTIAPTLDINSIQLGVASHAYQFQRTDSNVVQFVFDNILLVDSFRNEPKSHGFVKFKIQQKLNNPNGTKIYNSAGIYFDYNAPIITNRTFHTIGQNFVTVQLINTIKNSKYNVKEVKVFPNPFRDKTQIIVESNELKNPVLLLMNIQGQLIKTISSTNNTTFDIYRDDLSNGMYLFKIMQSDETVANGKVVVQ